LDAATRANVALYSDVLSDCTVRKYRAAAAYSAAALYAAVSGCNLLQHMLRPQIRMRHELSRLRAQSKGCMGCRAALIQRKPVCHDGLHDTLPSHEHVSRHVSTHSCCCFMSAAAGVASCSKGDFQGFYNGKWAGRGSAPHSSPGTCWTRFGESAVGGSCVGTEGKWVGAKCGAVAKPAGAPAYSYTLRVEACGETDLLPTVQGS
jgi:hypothetical protein